VEAEGAAGVLRSKQAWMLMREFQSNRRLMTNGQEAGAARRCVPEQWSR
jgi:hypothetical protein